MDTEATLRLLRQAVSDGDADTAHYLRSELKKAVDKRGMREPSDPNWRSA